MGRHLGLWGAGPVPRLVFYVFNVFPPFAGRLLQRQLKAFLSLSLSFNHCSLNNAPNKVDNKADIHPPPVPSTITTSLMNGTIRHPSCPGGEQAAPGRAAEPDSSQREEVERRSGRSRTGVPELTPGEAWTEQKRWKYGGT